MAVKRGTLLAFVAPCLPVAAMGLPLVVYLPPYYAGTLGLPLAAVGAIFLVVRLIDVPLDPFFGHLIDRTRTRIGKYRPWLIGGGLLMMLGVWLTFMAAPGIGAVRALAGLLTLYLGYSCVYLAHTAWGATLSDDYHERSRVFGWWQTANIAGIVMMLLVPPLVGEFAPDAGHVTGIHAMGWLVIVLMPLALLWIGAGVRERRPRGDHVHSLRDLIGVAKIPLFRRLLLIDLLASMAPGVAGALFLFFFEAAKGYTTLQTSLLLLIYFVSGLVCAPFWMWLARRTSKHRATMWALLTYAATQSALALIPGGDFTVTAAGMVVAGVPYAAAPFLLRAMLADLSAAETLRSGQEKTALFFAAITAVTKLGYAIPVGLTYPALALVGFVASPGAQNTPGAVTGLTLLFVIPPALLALLTAALVARWPIDAAQVARDSAALAGSNDR